jgi:hypothetical protein
MSWLIREKMAVLAPMPRASDRIATVVKIGDLPKLRSANLMSRTTSLTNVLTGDLGEGYTYWRDIRATGV